TNLVLRKAQNSCLEPRKAVIVLMVEPSFWQCIRSSVTTECLLFDLWTARVGKTEQFRHFIKGFANGIICCLPKQRVIKRVTPDNDLGGTTTHNKTEQRELRLLCA